MEKITVDLADVRIVFWLDNPRVMEVLNQIFPYHINQKENPFESAIHHDVIITGTNKKIVPPELPVVWDAFVGSSRRPLKWYCRGEGTEPKENIILIGDDVLIQTIPSRHLSVLTLEETVRDTNKQIRPGIHIYIFTLIFSVMSIYGKYTTHASCVAKNGKAVVFLGKSGDGKSTLSKIMGDAGYEYMGDDLVFISKDKENTPVVEGYLSKVKLFKPGTSEKEEYDLIKEKNYRYAYRRKIGALVKLQRTNEDKDSFLFPVSQAEAFAWLMNSGNNIKVQHDRKHCFDSCEVVSAVPAYTLVYGALERFSPAVLEPLFQ